MTPHTNISRKRFLAAYAECGMVSGAAKAAQIHRITHYAWLADPEYRKAFEETKRAVCDQVDDEIMRRGMHGVDEPVIWQGEIQYRLDKRGKRTNEPLTIRRYSDTLLIFVAKGLMPQKYRENYKVDVTADVTPQQRNPHLAKLTDEQLRILEQWHNEAAAAANGSGNGRGHS